MKNGKIKIVIGVLAIIGIIGLVILLFQGCYKNRSQRRHYKKIL
jgi:FtsZ-interacting cell division protein ZipA